MSPHTPALHRPPPHAHHMLACAGPDRACRSPAALVAPHGSRSAVISLKQRRQVLALSSADNGSEGSTAATATVTSEAPLAQKNNTATNGNGHAAAVDVPASSASSVPSLAALAAASVTEKDKDKEPSKHLTWTPDASSLPDLSFQPLSSGAEGWTKFKLAFALPWCVCRLRCVLRYLHLKALMLAGVERCARPAAPPNGAGVASTMRSTMHLAVFPGSSTSSHSACLVAPRCLPSLCAPPPHFFYSTTTPAW